MRGYLGIDNGTQGLSVIFTDENLQVQAVGDSSYEFVAGLRDGCYEQRPEDWDNALRDAMAQVQQKVGPGGQLDILAIGISGQMHGEVLLDQNGAPLAPVRLWCDARNEAEGHELTKAFEFKVPKRATCARFLWTTRHRPDLARRVRHVTTPAGWTAYRLTGEFCLGIGDAAGMFPVDQSTGAYHANHVNTYDKLVNDANIPSIGSILPKIRRAGQDAGTLSSGGVTLLGLPSDYADKGIPVAAAEGDQVAALAGSLIGAPGVVSCSFGTSVCANVVGEQDRNFKGVSVAVDHFCAAEGSLINMMWLRNGTTFLNTIVASFQSDLDRSRNDTFARVMPQVLQASPDCGGLLALPFMHDEPGLEVPQGGSAMLFGLNPDNATPGNMAKAALLGTMFNLKRNCGVLVKQGYPMHEIVLSGGLVKTPGCGQILADVFVLPVTVLASGDEGSS